MRRKILSMVTVFMMFFMVVGCGDSSTATPNSSSTKETQLSVSFKVSDTEQFQKAERTDVQSIRLSISKGSTFYLEAIPMIKDAVTNKWSIGINLDNSLAPFDVVAIARDSVDTSGDILFRTKIGTVIEDLTSNSPIILEEVKNAVSSINLPILKSVTHTTNGNTVNMNFVVQNTSSYALSSLSGGKFNALINPENSTNALSTGIGTVSSTEGLSSGASTLSSVSVNTLTGTVSSSAEASFSANYTKGIDESIVNLKAILTNAEGSSRTFSFRISEDVLSVNFPPEVVINVEEQLSPANTFKLTATVTDDDSTTWDYAWDKIRGAKVVTNIAGVSPNELYIESISTADEQYPLCFVLTVTDDGGASSSLDYCIKNAENGYVGVKKTGQTTSYNEAGVEVTDDSVQDDGLYKKGLTPQYTRDGTAKTVTDHVTGLVWQDDENVTIVKRPWVTQTNYDSENYFNTSGETATTYCASLTLADYTDWRLPTVKELKGLVHYGQYDPAINSTFVNTAFKYYWSSTTHAISSNNAWIVSFYSGQHINSHKSTNYYVRCVRAGQ